MYVQYILIEKGMSSAGPGSIKLTQIVQSESLLLNLKQRRVDTYDICWLYGTKKTICYCTL